MKLTNIFTFLKDNKILVEVKTALIKLIKDKASDVKPKIAVFLTDKSPKIKESLINYILKEIELPFYLKMFKPVVKKIISKNIDKLVNFVISIL